MDKLTLKEASDKYNVPYMTLYRKYQEAVNLEIVTIKNKSYIPETEANIAILKKIASKSLNRSIGQQKWCKTKVKDQFYDSFSHDEQIDIYHGLQANCEVKMKYWYHKPGHELWDEFYGDSPVTAEVDALVAKATSIIRHGLNKRRVNIIDVGCGNGMPAVKFIEQNDIQKQTAKYIAVDISESILDLAEANVKNTFTDLEVKKYKLDIEFESCDQILLAEQYQDPEAVNILLFVGNTINNEDDRVKVLKNLRSAMRSDDLLIITCSTNDYKNIAAKPYNQPKDKARFQWNIPLLGIDVNNCDYKAEYDETKQMKTNSVVLDQNYDIEFNIGGSVRNVRLLKGKPLKVWTHYLLDRRKFQDELELSNLRISTMIEADDSTNIMFICRGDFY